MPYTFTITEVVNSIGITASSSPVTVNVENIQFTVTQTSQSLALTQYLNTVTLYENAIELKIDDFSNYFKGDWTTGTTYLRGDIVNYANSLYVSNIATATSYVSTIIPSNDLGSVGSADSQGNHSDGKWRRVVWKESTFDHINVTNSATIGTSIAIGTSATIGTTLSVGSTATIQSLVLNTAMDHLTITNALSAGSLTVSGGIGGNGLTINSTATFNGPAFFNNTSTFAGYVDMSQSTLTLASLTLAGIQYPTTAGYYGQILTTNGTNRALWENLGDLIFWSLTNDLETNGFNIVSNNPGGAVENQLTIGVGYTGSMDSNIKFQHNTLTVTANKIDLESDLITVNAPMHFNVEPKFYTPLIIEPEVDLQGRVYANYLIVGEGAGLSTATFAGNNLGAAYIKFGNSAYPNDTQVTFDTLPVFNNGIKFSDGTTQTTAGGGGSGNGYTGSRGTNGYNGSAAAGFPPLATTSPLSIPGSQYDPNNIPTAFQSIVSTISLSGTAYTNGQQLILVGVYHGIKVIASIVSISGNTINLEITSWTQTDPNTDYGPNTNWSSIGLYSTGYTGSVGNIGPQGPIGYTGSASTVPGYNGSKGDAGGYTGSAGINGDVGYTGSFGLTGYTGSFGSKGYAGSASTIPGYIGSRGFTGYTGSEGIPGPSGPPGGYTGSQGTAGYNGSVGFVGSQGYTGSAGLTNNRVSLDDTMYTNGYAIQLSTSTTTSILIGDNNVTINSTSTTLGTNQYNSQLYVAKIYGYNGVYPFFPAGIQFNDQTVQRTAYEPDQGLLP